MIARHESSVDKVDIWAQLSAPLPAGVISWRQDGRAVQRDGKFFARFVAYVDANTVSGSTTSELDLSDTPVGEETAQPDSGELVEVRAKTISGDIMITRAPGLVESASS